MIKNLNHYDYSEKDGEYGGASCLKEGLLIDGENWLIKYPKNATYLKQHNEMSYTNDTVSEYLGSHIYQILGFPVHETILGERNGKIVVACKDFLKEGERLVEIRTLKNSANNEMAEEIERSFNSTGDSHIVNYEEMLLHLKYNRTICNIKGIQERFYDQIVIDAFINNSDRNNGNWGIIRSKGKEDILAPIFDNGGSFNGKTPDSRLQIMLERENGVKQSALNGISVYGTDHNFSNHQLLLKEDKGLKDAIIRNVPLIKSKMDEIFQCIDEIDAVACSDIRKTFYKESLHQRLELLLEPRFKELTKDTIKDDIEEDFER